MVAVGDRYSGIHKPLCFNSVSLSRKCWLIRQHSGEWREAKEHKGISFQADTEGGAWRKYLSGSGGCGCVRES